MDVEREEIGVHARDGCVYGTLGVLDALHLRRPVRERELVVLA